MAAFKYETHLHTAESSKCAHTSGAEFANYYKALSYTGVFVTDHFLNGNTTVPHDLPWDERITLFCRGYEAVAEQGALIGLDVFFGWEYSYGWTHFLTYGLDKAWLLAHPDLLEWNVFAYFDHVHADGGFIVHAHPFRETPEMVQLAPQQVDAIEVVNANRSDDENRHARDFAVSFGLPQTAGSDMHIASRQPLGGVLTSQRLSGGMDYLAALKSGDVTIFNEALESNRA